MKDKPETTPIRGGKYVIKCGECGSPLATVRERTTPPTLWVTACRECCTVSEWLEDGTYTDDQTMEDDQ